jgi:hypothetical protein
MVLASTQPSIKLPASSENKYSIRLTIVLSYISLLLWEHIKQINAILRWLFIMFLRLHTTLKSKKARISIWLIAKLSVIIWTTGQTNGYASSISLKKTLMHLLKFCTTSFLAIFYKLREEELSADFQMLYTSSRLSRNCKLREWRIWKISFMMGPLTLRIRL